MISKASAAILLLSVLVITSPATSQNGGRAREQQAEAFVRNYFAAQAGAAALDSLPKFYGSATDIEGMTYDFNAVLASRKALDTKWPKRKYDIRSDTVYVQCSSTVALCTVEATVDFVFEDSMSRRHGAFEMASGISFLSDPKFSFFLSNDLNVDEDFIRGSGLPAPMTVAPIPAPNAKGKKCMVFNGQQFCS
jgi:hypothetical protein